MYVIYITQQNLFKPLKTSEEIKLICKEYCEEVELINNDICCFVNQKYFEDLRKRVTCHNWVIDKIKNKHFLLYVKFTSPFI